MKVPGRHGVLRRGAWQTLLGAAALLGLVAAIVMLGAYGLQRSSPAISSPSAVETPAAIQHRPTLLVIGDFFAGGTGDPDVTTYPQLVADSMGWNLRVDALGSASFIENQRRVPDPQLEGVAEKLIDRLPPIVSHYRPDYILIDAGRNDLGKQPSEVIPAINEYLKRVRESWPRATIIIVKPQLVSETVPANYAANDAALSSAIDKAAAAHDAKVIDPVTEGWYTGGNLDSLLIYDGVHLNRAGQQFYADKIVADLEKFGLRDVPKTGQAGPPQ